MRLFEIAAPQSQLELVSTKRFLKNYAFYERGYPGIDKTFREFIEFKLQNPMTPFSKKDVPLSSGSLRGYRHVHLFHGKVILIYDIEAGQLRLLDVVEHTGVDNGRTANNLGDYLNTLGARDFQPYTAGTGTDEALALTPDQKADIESLMYEMAVQDRGILQAAMNGDLSGLAEFTRLTIETDWTDAQKDTAVLDAFGGQQGLQKAVQAILRNMGISESVLLESIDVEPGVRTVDDEGRTLISWPEFASRRVPQTCWYCEGSGSWGPDGGCSVCQGTGKVQGWEFDFPVLNVSNYNMEEVIAPLLGVEFDHAGFVEAEKLPELRRRLIRLKNGDPSEFAQDASDERGPARIDRSGDVPRITTGARMIYPGFSPERVGDTIDRLLAIIDWAQKNGTGLRWS